jgi:formylglycine-generating enzyme required for sulfatase activity
MRTRMMSLAVVLALVLSLTGTAGGVSISTVTVGNPGNADDADNGAGQGGVAYRYKMGKFEVTAGQYTEFLNAVADSDPNGLYDSGMWTSSEGCKIQQSGSSGSYTYSVAADYADRPVNYVSWGDAARFANWLHNGQPVGAQGLSTTEDGSYYLNGATTADALQNVRRQPDATWVIPSGDEWHKAAYHKNDGVTGNYWDYPTSSDSVPGYVNNSGNLSGGGGFTEGGTDPGNYATWDGDGGTDGIGSPYYRTTVGEWENSASPYGTFDQAGNLYERTEVVFDATARGLAGGSYRPNSSVALKSDFVAGNPATSSQNSIGFRLADVSIAGTELLADLAADYQDGTVVGVDSSDTVGLAGVGATWHFYEDTDDNPLNGGLQLLTYDNQIGGDINDTGYSGSVANPAGYYYPYIMDDPSGLVTSVPEGFLVAHPGDGALNPSMLEYMVVELRASAALTNLTLDYSLYHVDPNVNFDGVDWTLLDNTGTTLGGGTLHGDRFGDRMSVPDMAMGDSIWLVIGKNSANYYGDVTLVALSLEGNGPVPEPAGLGLIGLALLGLKKRKN